MTVYRKRSVEKISAELEYIRGEVKKAYESLEKLEGKEMYLQSELNFNKRLENGGKSYGE